MFSKLSDIDNIMHKKDAYALGLRLNALSSLCRALRTKEAVSALTAALDKLEADYLQVILVWMDLRALCQVLRYIQLMIYR